MLIEIFSEGKTMYMRAPAKTFDVIDLAGFKFEEEVKPESPEALYAAMPDSAMKVTDAVRKAVSKDCWRKEKGILEGVYKVDKAI